MKYDAFKWTYVRRVRYHGNEEDWERIKNDANFPFNVEKCVVEFVKDE